jgi:electron transport complex protein RnfA
MNELVWIFISSLLINNFVLTLFMGMCPFLGITSRLGIALRMGFATSFVLVITSICATILNTYVLGSAPYLRTISYIVVIASVVQITEMVVKKSSPKLFRELGIYLPLITTNCIVLAIAIFQTNRGYDFIQGFVFAIGAGLGFTLALVLMASIRVQLDIADVPKIARHGAIILIIAGCLSLAFMGFAGLFNAA